jgi:hypothetical protein
MLNQRNPNPVNEYPIERLYFSITMFDFGRQEPSNEFETVPIPGHWHQFPFSMKPTNIEGHPKILAVTPGNLNL